MPHMPGSMTCPLRLTGGIGSRLQGRHPAGWARVKRWGRHHRGQSVVELALILPLFIVLLAITFDVGRGMASYMTLIHAAREGAWVASKQPWDTPAVENAVRAALREGGLEVARARITVDAGPPGAPVTVTVTYAYDPLLPLPWRTITLRAQHSMVRMY